MPDEKVIMFDSPEAAQFKPVEGWVDSHGYFFGNDERTARYSGSTHTKCETCGEVHLTRSWCGACHRRKAQERFLSFPVEKWDGVTPTCLYGTETFFFGDAVLDYVADLAPDEEVQICKCTPGYLSTIDTDHWCDDLPEDGELPDAVQTALDALNEAIKVAEQACWWEDDIAIDVEDLRKIVKATAESGAA
jgi:hypothetical protein